MFESIIGNNKVKTILSNISTPSHAYLFLGSEGVGKFLFAKEFAYKWLCTSSSEERPCGKCKACVQFKGNNNMEFFVIEPEEGSIKVEQIRNFIKNVYEKPVESYKKIYVINDADKMTDSAQNALLKVLEEPPLYVMIILIGSNEQAFLNTIKSRCVKINFQELTLEELKQYFEKNGETVDERFLDIYQGSIGRDKKIAGQENIYLDLKENILSIENLGKIEFVKKSTKDINKENIKDILEYLNILMFKLGKDNLKYLEIISEINKAIKQCKSNCNVEMISDNLFLNIYDFLSKT